MSETPESVTPTTPLKKRRSREAGRRKRNLLILTLVFLIIAAVLALLYFLVWRYEESTNDAYVNGDVVQITAQIPGTVGAIAVNNTDTVKPGQTLVVLDDVDAQLAFERAKNELISAIRQNRTQKSQVQQAAAQVYAQKVALANAQADLQRRLKLAGTDAVSAEEISHAKAAVQAAQAALTAAQAQENTSQTVLGKNTPLEQQPAVQTAISRVRDAWLNLQRTHINAPIGGQIEGRKVQLGQKIAPGTPLMAVVPLTQVWVDANFKESQLANLRVGQKVTLESDVYGGQVTYHGTIAGLSAGTGSAFSVLPAQNATGNWIKVVQRVPVRIVLDPADLQKYPLRLGLSMNVKVDTRKKDGGTLNAASAPKAPVQITPDLKEADAVIAKIISDNQ